MDNAKKLLITLIALQLPCKETTLISLHLFDEIEQKNDAKKALRFVKKCNKTE